jgi:hypothetical protein
MTLPEEQHPELVPESVQESVHPPAPAEDSAATPETVDAKVAATPVPEPVQAESVVPEPTAEEITAAQAAAHEAVLDASRRHTRRSFVVAAAAVAGGYGFYRWLETGTDDYRQPTVLRGAFENNAAISRALFQEHALAPTYALNKAENLRVNGIYGLKQELLPESWRLQLVGTENPQQHPRYAQDVTAWEYRYSSAKSSEDQGHDTKVAPGSSTAEKMSEASTLGQEEKRESRVTRMPRGVEEAGASKSTLSPGTPGLLVTMDDLLKLPRYELVTQFKCIEGWSQIVHWAGIRMADFLDAYPPAPVAGQEPKYVYMETPNGDYYVGLDMAVCRHPQTLLVTEMMGAPLTQFHGAPLRLHTPTKYGYKQIKRIGLIAYTSDRPDDYWTKLGYDWYAGL